MDRWIRLGYLRPERQRPHAEPGPGNRWLWSDEEIRVAHNMVRLVAAGVRAGVAAKAARSEDSLVDELLLHLNLATAEVSTR